MISVEEARKIIAQKTAPLGRVERTALADAFGLVLAEDARIDMDIPPFDRCNMDGYAIASSDGVGEFDVVETVPAGVCPKEKAGHGKASKVMTGAPLPSGADAVVPVERTVSAGNGRVRISEKPGPGKNVTPRGAELKEGDLILKKGALLRPQEISMLATAGCSRPAVYCPPTIGILATGSELIEPDKVPCPGKIRNSNSYSLMAQCWKMGLRATYLGIAGDDPELIRERIGEGLENDFLLITGGMSMGDFDIAPDVLRGMGVRFWFEKVRIKPGKPVHFGTTENGRVVFGLPGNPVSTMVIFEQFVKPALMAFMGRVAAEAREKGVLKTEFQRRDALREEYLPVFAERVEDRFSIEILHYLGSGHMMALLGSNALMKIDAGTEKIPAGSVCEFQWL